MTTKTAKPTKSKKAARSPQARSSSQVSGLVADVRRRLGLSRKIFSRLTGFSERAIANWEKGGQPDEPCLRRIRETERFQARLAEVVAPDAIAEWLDTPNEAFDGLKPLEVIERGEIDRLWNMNFYLEAGVAS
jgi:DNA-binding transcriptional regulator YiaG